MDEEKIGNRKLYGNAKICYSKLLDIWFSNGTPELHVSLISEVLDDAKDKGVEDSKLMDICEAMTLLYSTQHIDPKMENVVKFFLDEIGVNPRVCHFIICKRGGIFSENMLLPLQIDWEHVLERKEKAAEMIPELNKVKLEKLITSEKKSSLEQCWEIVKNDNHSEGIVSEFRTDLCYFMECFDEGLPPTRTIRLSGDIDPNVINSKP